MDVSSRLSFFAALFKVDQHPTSGMWMLYIFIFVLLVAVYKLGFNVKRPPLLVSFAIYITLALGSTLLTFLGIFLPVAEGLALTTILLVLFRLRHHQHRKHSSNVN